MGAFSAYLARVRGFSPNAKLLLARSLISPLAFGIWGVVFNIYLLTVEVDGELLFGVEFIFTMVAVDWLVHGLAAFPGGLFSDRFGRRTTFLFASTLAVAASLAKLLTLNPAALLVLSGLAGFGAAFHAVTGGPFLIENCSEKDRTHLFSAQTTFGLISATGGALLGGLLPLAFAVAAGAATVEAGHARFALLAAIPVLLVGLLPIYLIREKWTPAEAFAKYPWYVGWAKNMRSTRTILKFCAVSALAALGLGAVIPVLNAYFFDSFGMQEEQVGYIFAIGSLAAAAGMTATPHLASRIGKVRTIAFTKLLAVPFLFLIPFAPIPVIAAVPYVLRALFNDMAGPMFSLFSMEQVEPHERGTTAGMIHSASEFPMGLTGLTMGGVMAATGQWGYAFGIAVGFTAIAYLVFLRLFRNVEAAQVPVAIKAGAL